MRKYKQIQVNPGGKTLLYDRNEVSHKAKSVLIQNQSNTQTLRLTPGDSVTPSNGLIYGPGAVFSSDTPKQDFYVQPTGNSPIIIGIAFELEDY